MVKSMRKYTSLLLTFLMIISVCAVMGNAASTDAAAADSGSTVYFEKPASWSNTPNVHIWGGTGQETTWPGKQMKHVKDNIYSYTFTDNYKNIIFNNGNGSYQTIDLVIETGKIYKITSGADSNKASGAWNTYQGTDPTGPTSPTEEPTSVGDGAIAALANTANWGSAYVYYWGNNKSNASWPGVKLTDADKDSSGNYVVNIPAEYISSTGGVIFNPGGDDGKSADLRIGAGECKIYDNSKATWEDYDTSKVQLKVTSDFQSPQYIGADIKINAAASGGSGSYKYKFSANSNVISDYSEKNSVVWTPQSAGTYTIKVDVEDSAGNSNSKTLTYEIKDDAMETNPVLKGVTTSNGTSIVEIGKSVDVIVKASGGKIGTNLLFYKMAIVSPSGRPVNTVYYRTGNTLNFTPTEDGVYKVEVSVQNSHNTTVTNTYELTTGRLDTPEVSSFDIAAADPLYVNGTATLSAQATGGTQPYSYSFEAMHNGQTTVIQSVSTLNTCKWVPTEAGDYTLTVTIKDATGATASRSKDITVLKERVEYKPGDVTGDGKVDLFDVLYIQRHIAKFEGYALTDMTEKQRLAADTTHDGKIDLFDILKIQRYIAKFITELD